MSVYKGFIRSLFMERGFCFLREHLTGVDVFVHRGEFKFDPALIAKGVNVTYEIVDYEKDGKPLKKAVNVTLTPDANGGAQ
jgi:cold shock CspA family protein